MMTRVDSYSDLMFEHWKREMKGGIKAHLLCHSHWLTWMISHLQQEDPLAWNMTCSWQSKLSLTFERKTEVQISSWKDSQIHVKEPLQVNQHKRNTSSLEVRSSCPKLSWWFTREWRRHINVSDIRESRYSLFTSRFFKKNMWIHSLWMEWVTSSLKERPQEDKRHRKCIPIESQFAMLSEACDHHHDLSHDDESKSGKKDISVYGKERTIYSCTLNAWYVEDLSLFLLGLTLQIYSCSADSFSCIPDVKSWMFSFSLFSRQRNITMNQKEGQRQTITTMMILFHHHLDPSIIYLHLIKMPEKTRDSEQ